MPDPTAAAPLVGQSVARLESRDKVRGAFRFLRDLDCPGALWACVVRSPYPHARVLSFPPAGAATGDVVAVFGFADVPAIRYNPATVPSSPQTEASRDKQMLTGEAMHAGDGVAVVVARSRAAARAAAARLPVRWQPLPVIASIDEALAAGAVIGRVGSGSTRAVEPWFETADLVVDETFENGPAQHVCLDAHACLAVPRGDGGTILYTAGQAPAEVGRLVREITGLGPDQLTVRKVSEGGGFGNKQDIYEEPLAVWLSRRLGAPVRFDYSRAEEFAAARTRHGMRIRQELALRSDGRILASRIDCVADSGAYASHTPYVLAAVAGHVRAAYPQVPDAFTGTAVRTHRTPAGAYRGYGVGQANFAFEQAVDIAANRLRIPPAELRLRNLGNTAAAACLARAIGLLRPAGNGDTRRPAGDGDTGRRAVGCSVGVKHSVVAERDGSRAAARWRPDGMIEIVTGTCDSGTGSGTALAQIAADELSLPLTAITVREAAASAGASDLGSTSQRSIFVGGLAVRDAARAARRRLLARAAAVAGRTSGGMTIRWPDVVDAATGEPVAGIAGLCACWPAGPDDGAEPGEDGGPAVSVTATCPDPGVSACAVVTEVAADVQTGVVRVLRTLAVVDCGVVVNPAAARGQVAGGIAQGIGLALHDLHAAGSRERAMPPDRIGEHGVPGALDVGTIDVHFLPGTPAEDSWAARGIGELSIVPVPAAIANAIRAATGARPTVMPMRPEVVWGGARRPATT
ncbi:MAG TPA: molybdopterin cofactor-binding domain-containing protein [Streptosporangiaceae bacterium]|jgi:xanthine dehydrogenase molybdenum-binding subunit